MTYACIVAAHTDCKVAYTDDKGLHYECQCSCHLGE